MHNGLSFNGENKIIFKKTIHAAVMVLVIILGFYCIKQASLYHKSIGRVADWLSSSAIEMDEGKTWPLDPTDPETISTNLYSGSAGIVLFFLEAYQVTGESEYLKEALAGADYLLSSIPETMTTSRDAGLYTGLTGIGFVLGETSRVSKEDKYLEGMKKCVRLLEESGIRTDDGIYWTDVTDIISGNAGIGLFLLDASKKFSLDEAEQMAVFAGRDLLTKATKLNDGLSWPMAPGYPRLMPNFAHGTAGVAYFLSRLYEVTMDESFLEGALAGGRRVLSLSKNGLICHHLPGGEHLFYLGWCHGPVGTGRLYYRLWKITCDEKWKAALLAGADAILESGIPENQTPGFWNNVSVCCGSAGVADYFLDIYKFTDERRYLDFSIRVTRNILNRAENDSAGMYWIQAEHRTRPDLLTAQTGLMQGAAGIGLWLLKLDAFEKKCDPQILLPDRIF